MRTVIVLEYECETADEREAVVAKIRREVPARGLLSVKRADGTIADRIMESVNPPKHKR